MGVITTVNQYHATGLEKLWAAIIVASILRAAEILVLRGRPGAAAG